MTSNLTTTNHSRDSAGLTYVYPVMSRRAGGLSIGINVNANNACNWRCVYCQVPDLKIGAAPDIDFDLLEEELRSFLKDVLQGDFYDRFEVEADKRTLKDIAISGNGEPTSAKYFARLVTLIGKIALDAGLLPGIKPVLITNGSLIHQANVQQGLKSLQALGGEVWFKLDSATLAGRQKINNTRQSEAQTLRNLRVSAELCPTKIQTCLLDYAGAGWSDAEQDAYIDLLKQVLDLSGLSEIMLYTLARPSLQPEAPYLKAVDSAVMQHFAARISALGFKVSMH
ncbi:MAG: radical SAM protein [Methylococcaceae bacterium]|nr:radical SAM protein [Methylococcaceae bacterium]